MDWGGAILAGVVATLVMTAMMLMGRRVGMDMDMPRMLGGMVVDPESSAAWKIGLGMHLMIGVIFGLIYAAMFELLDIDVNPAWGALSGAVHGAMVGIMIGMMPAMQPRMAGGGAAKSPGFFGINMGMIMPIGILAMHIVYGAVVGAVYTS